MKNSNNTFLNKPLPRFFGVIVLFLSIGIIFWLSRNLILINTKAALGNTPKEVQISNITDKSFTITYTTDEAVNGTLSFGNNRKMEKVAFDKRDADGPVPRKTHYITADGLEPGTKYYYSIVSGDKTFQNDTNPFEILTARTLDDNNASSSSTLKLRGKIINEDIKSEIALIILSIDNSQLLSTITTQTGDFELDLKYILKNDLSEYLNISSSSVLKIKATNGDKFSNTTALLNNANPLPPITLSQNYDFTFNATTASTASESAQLTPFPIPSDSIDKIPAILTPKTDEVFKDQQPLFRGTARPESDVEIVIESAHTIKATIQANKNGIWEYRPNEKLEPGEHTLTVLAQNQNGIIQALSNSFTVFAQGSQFTEPSVSPTQPTPTSTPIPSPTPTSEPNPVSTQTPTATAAPTPTISPTAQPTVAPTAIIILPTTAATTPSPTSQITVPPVPDVGSSSMIVGIIGTILAIGIGGLLFLLL